MKRNAVAKEQVLEIVTLEIEGPITPKARPRVTRSGQAYMPSSYRGWKTDAITQLRIQWGQANPVDFPASVTIELVGKHRRSGDADNTSGALLDAMVQAGVLKGDNLVCVPALSVNLRHSKQPPIAFIKITPFTP